MSTPIWAKQLVGKWCLHRAKHLHTQIKGEGRYAQSELNGPAAEFYALTRKHRDEWIEMAERFLHSPIDKSR